MIDQAIQFATAAHSGQTRKGSNKAYILHVLEVGIITANILNLSRRYDEEVITAAILHDVTEDSKVNNEALINIFSPRVGDLVEAMSEDKSKSWRERKQHTIDRMRQEEDIDKKIIALADKLANARALKIDLEQIGDKVWERFNVTDKNEHAWYYKTMADCFTGLEDVPELLEYKEIISEIFK